MSAWNNIFTVVVGHRRAWFVLALWIIVLVIASPFGAKLSTVEKNDPVSFLPASAQSTEVLQLEKPFPNGQATPAVVIYRRATGLTAADRAFIAAARRAIARAHIPGVVTVGPRVPSRDGKAVLFVVPINASADVTLLNKAVNELRRRLGEGQVRDRSGLIVEVTGPAGFSADAINVFSHIDTTLLLATVALVTVLLLIIYRSPFLWILPLIALGFAEAATQAAVYGLAKAGLTVNGMDTGLLTILVFGAGTDYALLLTARYREELRHSEDRYTAMYHALQQAGPAILASASTVAISLLCLLAADLNNNRSLGPIAAMGIVLTVLAMLTVLPALLLVLGRRVFWPSIPRTSSLPRSEVGLFTQVGAYIARHPRAVWITTTLILAIFALGLMQTKTNLNSLTSFRSTVPSVAGQRLVSASYPAGLSATSIVVVRPAALAAKARSVVASSPDVATIGPINHVDGLARFEVTLASPPYSATSFSTITTLRARLHTAVGSGALVGGPTAEELDTRQTAAHDTEVIVPLVLATVLFILGLLLRAVVAPLLLVATVIVSFAAALGVSVIIFNTLFCYPGIDPSLPLLAFIFLVALGVDYNIFLMARVREEAVQIGTKAGMLRSLAVTGGVITSAGIVLAGTFSVLTVLPLISLTEIGFVVAFGVLLDTLAVRSVLVPALTFDIGPVIWWPSSLASHGTALEHAAE